MPVYRQSSSISNMVLIPAFFCLESSLSEILSRSFRVFWDISNPPIRSSTFKVRLVTGRSFILVSSATLRNLEMESMSVWISVRCTAICLLYRRTVCRASRYCRYEISLFFDDLAIDILLSYGTAFSPVILPCRVRVRIPLYYRRV